MVLLSWFDNRTLFACQCVLAVLFAFVFVWMGRAYPSIRGIRSITLAFLLGIPCTFLLVSRGHLSNFLSIVMANLLAVVCFLLLYDGFVRFIGGRQRIGRLVCASAISIGVVYYYSEVQSKIVPRIIAMGLLTVLIHALIAWEFLRRSYGSKKRIGNSSANRGAMRFFGIFLAMAAVAGLDRTVMTVLYGAPDDLMQRNIVQTSTIFLGLVYIGVCGLCFLMMASDELITRSREESEKDSLSGVLNRRGIESRLSTELKRSIRNQQRLSVALVDIDYFKSINDKHGHATGDAAIRGVSTAISKSLRDGDYLGRYGGDEFLIILPDTACHQARIAGQRLSLAVSKCNLSSGERALTLSIGITEATPEDDAIRLIARADEALYQAKSDGRNCLRILLPGDVYLDATVPETARLSPSS